MEARMEKEIEEARGIKGQNLKRWMDEHWQELLHADRQMKGVVDMIKKKERQGLLSGMKGVGGWNKRWDQR